MPRIDDILILDGARTPVGTFLGGLSRITPTALGVTAAKGALERAGVSPEQVDATIFGNVLQSAKDTVYLARHVGLQVGMPEDRAALVVNRACASGMEAVIQGAKAMAVGEAQCVLAGGAENMSMTPYAMRGVRQGWRMVKSDVDDVLFSALHDPMAGCSIGETVEFLAAEQGITREEADAAAVEAQQRATRAQEAGVYAEEIVPVMAGRRRKPISVERDEAPRPESTLEALAALPGLYEGGVNTAGNSCGLNDAAAAVVMSTSAMAEQSGARVLGRVVSWANVGIAPKRMGLGPVEASRRALADAGLTVADLDVVELNDSFAVQSIAVQRALELDPATINPNGGALALGHPMGATGTRLVLSALYHLRRTQGRYGLATLCVGGGQGTAIVLERA
ncbi:MAG: thiolase family protein [Nannocystaceae bacterium]|nr:thiolase family protein [bacterium]